MSLLIIKIAKINLYELSLGSVYEVHGRLATLIKTGETSFNFTLVDTGGGYFKEDFYGHDYGAFVRIQCFSELIISRG